MCHNVVLYCSLRQCWFNIGIRQKSVTTRFYKIIWFDWATLFQHVEQRAYYLFSWLIIQKRQLQFLAAAQHLPSGHLQRSIRVSGADDGFFLTWFDSNAKELRNQDKSEILDVDWRILRIFEGFLIILYAECKCTFHWQ